MNSKSQTKTNLLIVLLSIDGKYRQPKLPKLIAQSGIDFLELNATTPNSIPKSWRNRKITQLFRLGRLLIPSEVATFITHANARKCESALNFEWLLIVEDDAIVSEASLEKIIQFASTRSIDPMFLNLLPAGPIIATIDGSLNPFGEEILETSYLHSGAVAYMLNRAARNVINIDCLEITSLADFPAIFNLTRKFVPLQSSKLVEHNNDLQSTIYSRNIIPRNNKVWVALGILSSLSFFLGRRDYVSFSNYIKIEIVGRLKRRRALLR